MAQIRRRVMTETIGAPAMLALPLPEPRPKLCPQPRLPFAIIFPSHCLVAGYFQPLQMRWRWERVIAAPLNRTAIAVDAVANLGMVLGSGLAVRARAVSAGKWSGPRGRPLPAVVRVRFARTKQRKMERAILEEGRDYRPRRGPKKIVLLIPNRAVLCSSYFTTHTSPVVLEKSIRADERLHQGGTR